MRLISWSLDHPVAVFTTVAALGVLAVASWIAIPVEMSPPIELPELRLDVQWSGVSAFTVESTVTRPLESLVQQLDHVTDIRSVTREGHSELVVKFDKGANIEWLEVDLNERLHQFVATAPADMRWPKVTRSVPEELSELTGFLSYRLHGEGRPGELRSYAEKHLLKALLAVPGIRDVQLEGGKPLEIVVDVDEGAVVRAGLSAEDIAAFQARLDNRTTTLGPLADADLVRRARVEQGYADLGAIRALPVVFGLDGRTVRLGDVANVYWGATEDFSRIRVNGHNSVLMKVEKYPGVDLMETAAAVETEVARAMRAAPRGFGLIKEMDKAEELSGELEKIGVRSAFSLAFIAAIVVLTYRRISATFVLWGVILLVLLYAVGSMYLAGMTLNVLTLAGLTVGYGLGIDNAIVVYDSVRRHFDAGGVASRLAVLAGTSDVLKPLLASNLTTVGSLLPVLFLSQALQLYFLPVAVSLGATVVFSFLLSCFLLPPLMLVLRRRGVGV